MLSDSQSSYVTFAAAVHKLLVLIYLLIQLGGSSAQLYIVSSQFLQLQSLTITEDQRNRSADTCQKITSNLGLDLLHSTAEHVPHEY